MAGLIEQIFAASEARSQVRKKWRTSGFEELDEIELYGLIGHRMQQPDVMESARRKAKIVGLIGKGIGIGALAGLSLKGPVKSWARGVGMGLLVGRLSAKLGEVPQVDFDNNSAPQLDLERTIP